MRFPLIVDHILRKSRSNELERVVVDSILNTLLLTNVQYERIESNLLFFNRLEPSEGLNLRFNHF